MIQKGQPPMQGYNAQAAVTTGQIVIAAEVLTSAPDYARLEPVVHAALRELGRPGSASGPPRCSLTRATGTPNRCNVSSPTACRCSSRPTADCAPARGRAGKAGYYAFMRRVLATTTATRSTPNANTASSRCSGRSKTTAAWTASNEEAAPPSGRNGG